MWKCMWHDGQTQWENSNTGIRCNWPCPYSLGGRFVQPQIDPLWHCIWYIDWLCSLQCLPGAVLCSEKWLARDGPSQGMVLAGKYYSSGGEQEHSVICMCTLWTTSWTVLGLIFVFLKQGDKSSSVQLTKLTSTNFTVLWSPNPGSPSELMMQTECMCHLQDHSLELQSGSS